MRCRAAAAIAAHGRSGGCHCCCASLFILGCNMLQRCNAVVQCLSSCADLGAQDEVHKAQLSIIPHPILEVFRVLSLLLACSLQGHESSMRQWQRPGLKPGRCIPSGQLSRDQMVSLLRELDPSLEMREVQKFMVDSFSDSACVDCPSLS